MVDLFVSPAGTAKKADEIYIGTAGGNKKALKGWIGTPGGNKLFFDPVTTPPPLSVSISPSSLNGVGASPLSLGSVTAQASGGTGTTSYLWERVSGFVLSTSATNQPSISFTRNGGFGFQLSTYRVTVTKGGETATRTIQITSEII